MRELEDKMDKPVNVLGGELRPCSHDPLTGFFRDGCCNTGPEDAGSHAVCIRASRDFLEYSRFRGNDLSTPRPEFGFQGVQPDQSWCLCASRWLEAYHQGMAPGVYLLSTHIRALDIITLDKLKELALDLN
jgi:uncharacterized protein (DUF2237 family)